MGKIFGDFPLDQFLEIDKNEILLDSSIRRNNRYRITSILREP